MDNENLYAAPRTVVDGGQDGPTEVLAGRGARLGAIMVDGLAVGLIYLPFYFFGVFKYLVPGHKAPGLGFVFGLAAVTALVTFVIFLGLNITFMRRSGQTIGKRVAGIRVVMSDSGEQATVPAQLKRYAFMYLVRTVPFLGSLVSLVDTLCIFRDSRRCLHDDVAKTMVINA